MLLYSRHDIDMAVTQDEECGDYSRQQGMPVPNYTWTSLHSVSRRLGSTYFVQCHPPVFIRVHTNFAVIWVSIHSMCMKAHMLTYTTLP